VDGWREEVRVQEFEEEKYQGFGHEVRREFLIEKWRGKRNM
jgi:hypothetical protein